MTDPNYYAPPLAEAGGRRLPASADDEGPVEYAGFGIRAAARIVDVVATVLFGALGGFIGGVIQVVRTGHVTPAPTFATETFLMSMLFSAIGGLFYHSFAEGLGGATVGKLILGLRVKREGSLEPCGVAAALGRNAAYYVDAFFFGLVAYSAMSKSRMSQRLGDQWAETVVVRSKSLPARARGGEAPGLIIGAALYVVVSTVSIALRG
jgi:uncharacterized RDD family membrane protein YckC